jgi:hypothetical protein
MMEVISGVAHACRDGAVACGMRDGSRMHVAANKLIQPLLNYDTGEGQVTRCTLVWG